MKLVLISVADATTTEAIQQASVAFSMTLQQDCRINVLSEEDLTAIPCNPSTKRMESALCDIIGMCKSGPDGKNIFWQLVYQGKITKRMLSEFVEHSTKTMNVLKKHNYTEMWNWIKAFNNIKDFM